MRAYCPNCFEETPAALPGVSSYCGDCGSYETPLTEVAQLEKVLEQQLGPRNARLLIALMRTIAK
jgi:hypothetical protein